MSSDLGCTCDKTNAALSATGRFKVFLSGVKFPGPFLAENVPKAHIVGADLKGGSEDIHRKWREIRRI